MDNQQPSSAYIEGFNKGYILREHKPDLARQLVDTRFPESEQEFSTGFKDGVWQKEQELTKEKLAQQLQEGRSNDRSRGK